LGTRPTQPSFTTCSSGTVRRIVRHWYASARFISAPTSQQVRQRVCVRVFTRARAPLPCSSLACLLCRRVCMYQSSSLSPPILSPFPSCPRFLGLTFSAHPCRMTGTWASCARRLCRSKSRAVLCSVASAANWVSARARALSLSLSLYE